ncbi:NUDIX hydrolase [Fusibacter ferrireducens]|uniref:NUDIX hydrolase n=1 Tax=Fusibacter ferrireducens TaxID=2785058 RepID=A0ABS0A0U1_9FIRM|nr:NUDIX hydrolase [Fusibacter ferrireducens]MBF4696063.1 NUDIX hydrolase [Fusibacter ferrireducens]
MDYISSLRKYIGTQPIIMCGANVIIINEENEILLHHRTDRDWWGLPGGAMELGESMEETARREVLEEINIECLELELFNVYSGEQLYYKYPDGNEVYNVTVTYLCKSYKGEIKVEKSEGRDAKFYKIDDIPKNISEPVLPIISEYIKKSQNGILKTIL